MYKAYDTTLINVTILHSVRKLFSLIAYLNGNTDQASVDKGKEPMHTRLYGARVALISFTRCNDVVAWLQRRHWSRGVIWWFRRKHYHDIHCSSWTLQRSYVRLRPRRFQSLQKWLSSVVLWPSSVVLWPSQEGKTPEPYTKAECPASTWLQLLHLSDGV